MEALLNLVYYEGDPLKTVCALLIMGLSLEFMSLMVRALSNLGR